MADVGSTTHHRTRNFDYDPAKAVARLRRVDPILGTLIKRVGAFELQSRDQLTPFQTLLRAIVSQQISVKAAASIDRRLRALFPHHYPSPKRLLSLPESELRGAGLSRSKVRSVRDLAQKCLSNVVPNRRVLNGLDDDSIVEQLTCVHGIGRWTVEMLLIFHLGRADVLPVADLGVRKGFMLHRGDEQMPSPKALEAYGECWRPYRSVASWYLWRANYITWETAD